MTRKPPRHRALAVALAGACAVAGARGIARAEEAAAPPPRWSLTALGSHSELSADRPAWGEGEVELLFLAPGRLVVGGLVDARDRNHVTDVLYGGSLAWYPLRTLELHGRAAFTPDADFSPQQIYSAGVDWRVMRWISLQPDYERLEFDGGAIDEGKAGATLWITDGCDLAGRYVRGRDFDEKRQFEAWSVRADLGRPRLGRLSVGFARGVDPEKDIPAPGAAPVVLRTIANTWSAYLQIPARADVRLIAGVEYEDRIHLYYRTTFAAGFSARF